MIKTIQIDGKEIQFKATAATPREYRRAFGRDIYIDLTTLYKDMEKGESLSVDSLEIFENLTFIMAMQAEGKAIERETVNNDMSEWLDQFDTFSIYKVVPQIMELCRLNTEQTSEPKNPPARPKDK